MPRNWTLGLVAALIWLAAFGWYFVGSRRLALLWASALDRIGLRRQ